MIAYCKIDEKLAAFNSGDGDYEVNQVIQWIKEEHKVDRVLVLVHDAKQVLTKEPAAA